jgi:uncharacterized protein (DUF697 family)
MVNVSMAVIAVALAGMGSVTAAAVNAATPRALSHRTENMTSSAHEKETGARLHSPQSVCKLRTQKTRPLQYIGLALHALRLTDEL